MLERFSNVAFFLFYALSVFVFCIGVFSRELHSFIFAALSSVGLFIIGWSIRYVLTGKKNVPGFNTVITRLRPVANLCVHKIKSFFLCIRSVAWKQKVQSTLRIVLIIFIAGAAGSAAKSLVNYNRSSLSVEDLDKHIRSNPQLKIFTEALSSNFPLDYKDFIKVLHDASKKRNKNELKLASYQFMKSFMSRHAVNIVAAPNSYVQNVLNGHITVLSLLRNKNVKLCADFGVRGLGHDVNVDGETLAELVKVVNAQIISAYEGENRPVKREEPTENDFEHLINAMSLRGVSLKTLNQFFVEGDVDSLPISEQCDLSYIMLNSLMDLEEDVRIRLFAFMLLEAFKM